MDKGQKDKSTNGQKDKGTKGQNDKRTKGLKNNKTKGQNNSQKNLLSVVLHLRDVYVLVFFQINMEVHVHEHNYKTNINDPGMFYFSFQLLRRDRAFIWVTKLFGPCS